MTTKEFREKYPEFIPSEEKQELLDKREILVKELKVIEDVLWDKHRTSFTSFDHGDGEGPFV